MQICVRIVHNTRSMHHDKRASLAELLLCLTKGTEIRIGIANQH